MICDIIIPTYNSAELLPATLRELIAQTISPSWQCHIIVSDDGSSDETKTVADQQRLPAAWELTVVAGPHTGPGGARLRAIPRLLGDVVFLLGADILLRPGALQQHLMFHERHPAATDAALGMVRWDPRLPPTALMEWMTHGGQQNDFDALLGQVAADPAHFFYGSHLSLKTALLRRAGLGSTLQGYGWEDLSMGRELQKQGLNLHILHRAIGLHYHFSGVADIAGRQQTTGYHFRDYQKLYPDVAQALFRSRSNHLRRAAWIALGGQAFLMAWLKTFAKVWSLPRLFLVFTANEFWKGVWRSQGGFLAFLKQNSMFYSKPR